MANDLERRIEALEERRRSDKSRIAVVHQNPDGSWPPDPPGASLVIRTRSVEGMVRDSERKDSERLRSAISEILTRHPQPETLTTALAVQALERAGIWPLPSEDRVLRHLIELRGH